jgi:opacity protein-like surface antigen
MLHNLSVSRCVLPRGASACNFPGSGGGRRRAGALLAGLVAAFAFCAPTGALAASCTFSPTFTGDTQITGVFAAGVSGALTSAVTNSNLAFLSGSEAFVAGGGSGAQPDQMGGGVWSRAIGGDLDYKQTSTTNVTTTEFTSPPQKVTSLSGTVNCDATVQSGYFGMQGGADIAKFNVNGWDFHVGATAGGVQSSESLVGGLPAIIIPGETVFPGGSATANVQAPFVGAYFTASHEGFYFDALIRGDFYSAAFNSGVAGLFDQDVNAQGFSISASTGYSYTIPNSNWFVVPSAGVVYSRVSVDPLNTAGPPSHELQGTFSINDIVDTIGRIGVNVGTSFEVGGLNFQPFAGASVWHDFDQPYTGNYTTCSGTMGHGNGCVFVNPGSIPGNVTAAYTGSNFGTFGQYSVGVNVQIPNTGWLGFARADYRDGADVRGFDVTGGFRYQFSDVASAAPELPTKKGPPPAAGGVNWTGFYLGGFGGAGAGWSQLGFANGTTATPDPRGFLVGGEAGYNYQLGNLVLGAEGDFGGDNLKGSKACAPLLANTGGKSPLLFNTTCNSDEDWIGTLTGRVGYTWERALFYVKAGGAFSEQTYSTTCNLGPTNGAVMGQNCVNSLDALTPGGSTGDVWRLGWTAGLGFEYALFGNFSTKAEFDYANFGSRNFIASDGTSINNIRANTAVEALKIGINYRFGGS